MCQQRSWLDLLTETVLSVSARDELRTTPRDWLNQTATEVVRQFGPGTGVALIRVARGESKTPWAKSTLAVRCGDKNQSYEWRERYTFATVSAGITPEDYLRNDHNDDWRNWAMGEPNDQPKEARMIENFASRYGVQSFVRCCGPMPHNTAGNERAFLLDFWSLNPSDGNTDAPKKLFKNIARTLSTFLHRVECDNERGNENMLNRLTPCQRRVASLLIEGLSEKQAAARLGRSHHTVHQHVKAIYSALSVRSRAEFMARCIQGTGSPIMAEYMTQ